CVDDELQLASLLDMRYKLCLSQNEHLLVLKCALSLEACEDSSSQRPCLAQLIFSFITNLSRSSAKQSASVAAYQFSRFSEYTKSSQQAEAAVHQLLK